jgi:hypothetical protein
VEALIEGVRQSADRTTANTMQIHYTQFHLVGWNPLFYQSFKDITPDIPWIDALMNKHGPTEQDIKEARSWHKRLDGLFSPLQIMFHSSSVSSLKRWTVPPQRLTVISITSITLPVTYANY